MFYDLISKKRDEWFSKKNCPVLSLIEYMKRRNYLRDAQLDAIKTYLYLKIECKNQPLYDLFLEGKFNTLTKSEIEELPLPQSVRRYFVENPAVVSLYEYASKKDSGGKPRSQAIVNILTTKPQDIDYKDFFKKIFYGVSYPDYLFSLPMGAGKTYLMAAFIYLDLYFAQNEMTNPVFAHNFIILAPSGTKSSIIPSLRTIQDFDPANVVPEPAATNLKRLLAFEVLDESKTAAKSNKIKNPNVQKIAVHQPLQALFGLVIVTNAEKVILDKVQVDNQAYLIEPENIEDEKERLANELRHLIGKIPSLGVFIDEVHHAESGDIKLRAVVNKWATETKNVNSVLGFSGTPYLEKQEKISLTEEISVKSTEISSIVFYYPLSLAIGNFLKVPSVNIRAYTSEEIVREAVDSFLAEFGNKTYADGTSAKIGIYCGTIENLEENIYPEVSQIAVKWGYNPDEVILKNHDGNKKYKEPEGAKSEFASLDKVQSKKKIVLLVNIGKEGWSCKSLTAVILTQKSQCPKNMVLQTSCRCLREVTNAATERAFIYMNSQNAEILQNQLEQQYKMNLEDFQKGARKEPSTLKRYDRTEHLNLPSLDFYQLKVQYDQNVTRKASDAVIREEILKSTENCEIENPVLETARFTEKGLEIITKALDSGEHGTEPADFSVWKFNITKNSFGFLKPVDLKPYESELKKVFEKITYDDDDGQKYFSSKYDHDSVESRIRNSFSDKREILTKEEKIPQNAKLLAIKDGTDFMTVTTFRPEKYFPNQQMVENIIKEDSGEILLNEKTKAAIESLRAIGREDMIQDLISRAASFPHKDKTLHYLPFYADSNFESKFLQSVLTFDMIQKRNLEVYYNGDNNFTDFQIKCHKKTRNGSQVYIGRYTPDFLILSRDQANKIEKVLIVETKGSIYAENRQFQKKKDFAQDREHGFLSLNPNMEYLYLEDTMTENEIQAAVTSAVEGFFGK